MSRVSFDIGTHGVATTASEMRKRLAQVLSKIPGDQIVFFNLTLHMENYSPAPDMPMRHTYTSLGCPACDMTDTMHFETAIYGELARPEND